MYRKSFSLLEESPVLTERLLTPADMPLRAALLARRGLGVPGNENRILGLFDEDETLVATGSRVGNTLQGFAVDPGRDGEGLLTRLVTTLLTEALALSPPLDNVRVFTTAASRRSFVGLGFTEVLCTEQVALLEWRKTFAAHLVMLGDLRAARERNGDAPTGAVVMNANPITRGHVWLAEQAAARCAHLYIFVVEEDRSEVPFAARLAMVQAVLSSPSVTVLPGGPYMISSATFPSYFTRDTERVAVHAELDLRLFVAQAHALGVTHRFAGDEPLSPSTAVYNEVMQRQLPSLGVDVTVFPRLNLAGEPVSASHVRALLAAGRIDAALELMPEAARPLFLQTVPFLKGLS